MSQEAIHLTADVRAILVERAGVFNRLSHDLEEIKTAQDLGIDGSGYEEEMTPKERLLQDLFPLLKTQLNQLVSHPQSIILPIEPKEMDSIQKDFESFEHTCHLIHYIHHKFAEAEYKKKDRSLMFKYQKSVFDDKICNGIKFICRAYQLWYAPTQTSDIENCRMPPQTIKKAYKLSDRINEVVIFLTTPIVYEIYRKLQTASDDTSNMLIFEPKYKDLTATKNITDPVVKLCRLFMDKVSKRTSNARLLLRHIDPEELLYLHESLEQAKRSTESLCSYINNERRGYLPLHALGGGAKRRVMSLIFDALDRFRKSSGILAQFLASPPPDLDQELINFWVRWIDFWSEVFHFAVYDAARFILKEEPRP